MINKRFGKLIMAICILSFIYLPAKLTSAEKAGPGFFSFKVGKIEVIAMQDAAIEMDSQLVKNGDPAVLKKLMPEGKLPASVNAFVIRTGEKTILVDAGLGDGTAGKGKLLECMKAARIAPADIDTVVITHEHFDHTGGLVNKGKAVFPSAKLMFSKKEIKALYSEPAKESLKAYKGRVEGFEPGDVVAEGVKTMELYGHTQGHSGVMIESGGKKLLIFGDLLHITKVQFPYPDYSLVYDADPVKAAETRKGILEMASKEKIYVAGMHIKFPGIGTVSKKGDGYLFTPVK